MLFSRFSTYQSLFLTSLLKCLPMGVGNSSYSRQSSWWENLMHLEKRSGICAEGRNSHIWGVVVVSFHNRCKYISVVWICMAGIHMVTCPSWGSHCSARQVVKHKQHHTGDRKWVVMKKERPQKIKNYKPKDALLFFLASCARHEHQDELTAIM